MSNLDKINFKDYIYDYNDLKNTEVKLLNKKELNKKIKKKKILNKFKSCFVKNTILKLNGISDTFKRMCHSMEYYLVYLKNSKNNNIIDDSLLSIFNILNLDLSKDECLTKNKGEYISIEKFNLFFIPDIEISLNKNIVNLNIRDENNIYNFELNHLENDDFFTLNSDNLLEEANDMILYFRKKYSLIASIINQLKINESNTK